MAWDSWSGSSCLSKAEVSYAYPLISLGYVFTAILARVLFGEAVGVTRMAGIFDYLFGGVLDCPELSGPGGVRGQGSRTSPASNRGPASRLARQAARFS